MDAVTPALQDAPVGVPRWSAQELADREAVLEVLHHYCYCVDHKHPDRVADEVFAPDAVDDHAYATWTGREELREAFRWICAHFAATAHLLANPRIRVEGDVAHSHVHVTAWHWMPGGSRREADFVVVGTYEDELRRLEEGWRIVHRRFRRVGPTPSALGELPDFLRRYGPDLEREAGATA